MFYRVLSLCAVGVLGLAGIASAATKLTPALGKSSTDSFICRVLNGGATPITVEVEIIGSNGAVLTSASLGVPNGWAASASYSGSSTIGYCKVSGAFSARKTRVTLCVVISGGRCEVAVGDPGGRARAGVDGRHGGDGAVGPAG